MAKTYTKIPKWRPNFVPLATRILNIAFAFLLIAYGLAGVFRGSFKVVPPKSKTGLVLYDQPAWLFATAIFIGVVVLLSVVIDHYDKRNNERRYLVFKRVAVGAGLFLLLAALVAGFFIALIGGSR